MTNNPYAAPKSGMYGKRHGGAFRLLPAFLFMLAGFVFFAHGALIAGNYFTYSNGALPPKFIGKLFIISMVAIPIAISVVSAIAGFRWLTASKTARKWTTLAVASISIYSCWFVLFAI